MTRRLLFGLSAAAALAAFGAADVQAGPKSGLQVGDRAGPFNVRDITGPNAGTKLCYR